jgi:hypothetical protein
MKIRFKYFSLNLLIEFIFIDGGAKLMKNASSKKAERFPVNLSSVFMASS